MEGTGHQPSAISRQPGFPPKQRLLCTTAPAVKSIDRPSPHRAGGHDSITAAVGSIDSRPWPWRFATMEAAEGGSGSSVDVLDGLIMCGSDFPLLPIQVQAYSMNSTKAEI